MADLRDKRDKAQRVLDRLVEEKRVLHEEACAKVNSQKEELGDIERQVSAARVQVNLPTPPPTLSSDDGDWDQGEEGVVLMALKMKPGGRLKRGWAWTLMVPRGKVVGHVGEAGLLRLRFVEPQQAPHASSTFYPFPTGIGLSQSCSVGNTDANERAEEMRKQMGEENWDRLIAVPPAPDESG